MLRVALIGCGKIADAHASQIQRIKGCEIVAVCDQEELMARQLADRFRIPNRFTEIFDLLRTARPDVVHITTPPQSHFELASLCLQHRCHVYVEKPFTLNAGHAETLISLANRTGRKLTTGHDLQYSHVARRMRKLIATGYLGSQAVHMESTYGYDIGGPEYAKALLSDKGHWVRKLPGKLLHNIISHGVARIAEFLGGTSVRVMAQGFVSPFLRELGETRMVDELRVVISDSQSVTAYFTFSSQMRPVLNQFSIYGTKNGLLLDEDHQTLIKYPGERLKSYAGKFIPPARIAWQHVNNLRTNLGCFLKSDFHMKSGLKYLIDAFYKSISHDAPLPISYREILLTAQIMDSIFEQVDSPSAGRPAKIDPSLHAELNAATPPIPAVG